MVKIIPFEKLASSDLIVDAVYEGGIAPNLSAEPLSKLLPGVGNQAGFRASRIANEERFVALFTSGVDADWPDRLDPSTGKFTYFGDNKKPGRELHDTTPGGNALLRRVFSELHSNTDNRENVPPFFVFQNYPTKKSSRSVQFKGLAVPGYPGLTANSDLVAVWRTTKGERFQNYQATFTILDCSVVTRMWINELLDDNANANAPDAWVKWLERFKF